MKRLIVPTDFSPAADHAVRYAIRFAHKAGCGILFFHSVNSSRNDPDLIRRSPAEYQKLKIQAEEELKKNILAQYKKVKINPDRVVYRVKFGKSFKANLYELLTEVRGEMLVMSTHGSARLLNASSVKEMIAHNPLPVLCVPANGTFPVPLELTYFTDLRNVRLEINRVKKYAAFLGARVSVVHFDYGWAREKEENALLRKLEAGSFAFRNIKVSIDVPFLDHIRKYHRDKKSLICLFHDKKNLFQKLFTGSNPEEAPLKIHAPVLSFQRN